MTTTSEEIIAEAHRRAMALPGLNVSQRRAASARIANELAQEAEATARAVAITRATVEAAQERDRVAAAVQHGTSMGRARGALWLALAGPVDAAAVRAVLATLPLDSAGPAPALPAPASFGTAAEQAERERIRMILNCEQAKGREQTAMAFALQTAVAAEVAIGALAVSPKLEPYRGPSIEERVRAAGDFGATFDGGHQSADDRAAEIWRKATATAASRHPGATSEADVRREAVDELHSKNLRAEVDAHLATQMENAALIRGQRD